MPFRAFTASALPRRGNDLNQVTGFNFSWADRPGSIGVLIALHGAGPYRFVKKLLPH